MARNPLKIKYHPYLSTTAILFCVSLLWNSYSFAAEDAKDRLYSFLKKDMAIGAIMLVLASDLPLTGPPDTPLATIANIDSDGDGKKDVDQILNSSRDLVLAMEDVGVSGQYHVLAVLFMESGGEFQPVPGIDYMAGSGKLTLGLAQAEVALPLEPVPATQ